MERCGELIVVPPEHGRHCEASRQVHAAGHNKRHNLIAQAFRELCEAGLQGWELHLAGSLHQTEEADIEYYPQVEELGEGHPVFLHPNAARQ